MSFTENLYLKRQLKQLHEENLKLKQIINEVYGPGAYPNPNDMRAVDRVYLKPDDFEPMDELEFTPTPEELIRIHGGPGNVDLRSLSPELQRLLGAAHASDPKHRNRITASNIDKYPEYAAGARSVDPKAY